ncbi:UbiA family prenyltransferase, partial [Aspergillus ibericus CBS 121593]
IYAITEELSLVVAILRDNFTAHCGNAFACLSTRLLGSSLAFQELKGLILKATLTIIAFSYVFDIANQAFSVEEDAVNKPTRPIPSGRLSRGGAYARWLLSWILFPVLVYFAVSLRATSVLVLWEVWVFIFYVWPKVEYWWVRNIFTAVGAILQLTLLDTMLTDTLLTHDAISHEAKTSLKWILFIWLFMTIHIQEFQDMEGDRHAGRKTLPLVLCPKGQFWLRVATAVFIGATPVVSIALFRSCLLSSWTMLSPGLLLLALCHLLSMLTVAVRLVTLPFKEADKATYKYYYILATYLMLHMYANVQRAVC